LQAFERVGLNLYLAGAATALSERGAFPESVRLDLLRKALTHTGTHASVAEAFVQRLDVSAQRPRFKQLIDAGHAAMTAQADGNTAAALPSLVDLIKQWADPNVRGAEIKKVTFLLTDIVGSTALTSKIGNSGAQRVVRAHNAAARAACKNFRGTEVKHTGDGMLLTFPDAAAAGRAAMEIQAEGSAYARDNPDAPLVMRIGIHTGEASFEEGEYYGPALSYLNGVCSAAGDNQIFCSDEAKSRCVGPAFRFQDMGKRVLKGSDTSAQVHKLDWTPKTKVVKGPLEYGQIGKKAPA
jgi:adenylate cyclase